VRVFSPTLLRGSSGKDVVLAGALGLPSYFFGTRRRVRLERYGITFDVNTGSIPLFQGESGLRRPYPRPSGSVRENPAAYGFAAHRASGTSGAIRLGPARFMHFSYRFRHGRAARHNPLNA
jgi:hypothetical protein